MFIQRWGTHTCACMYLTYASLLRAKQGRALPNEIHHSHQDSLVRSVERLISSGVGLGFEEDLLALPPFMERCSITRVLD